MAIKRIDGTSIKDGSVSAADLAPGSVANNLGYVPAHAPATTAVLKGDGVGGFAPAVPGTDLKTINGNSILGAGDITIASLSTDWQNPGVIGATTPNAATFTSLSLVGGTNVTTSTYTTSTLTPNQVIDAWPYANHQSAQYTLQITSSAQLQNTTIVVMHDGTNVYLTEYGVDALAGSLASFDADIYLGNLRLLMTPVNIVTTVKILREAL